MTLALPRPRLLAWLALVMLAPVPEARCQYFGLSNASRLQQKPICSPLTTTNGYVLTWNASSGCLELAANGGASGSVTTSGLTTNTVPKATGSSSLGDSLISDDGTTVSVAGRVNIKGNPFTIELPNSSTGTTNNKLAKAVVNGGVLQAQIVTTSSADQAAVLGCVISGGGTSGTAVIMIAGTGSCYFDGATTAGHIAVPSSTSAGALHDTGSTSSPSSGEVMATVGATNACGSPPCLIAGNLFLTPDLLAGNGNGGGGGPPSKGSTTNQNLRIIPFSIDAGTGNTLSGTLQRCGTIYFSGTIQAVTLLGNVTGSASVDIGTVRLTSYTGPSSAASITAAAIPALASATRYNDTTLTGWTTAITSTAANPTVVCFTVTGESSLQWLQAALQVAAN